MITASSLSAGVNLQEDDQTVTFKLERVRHRVSVEPSGSATNGTDIILSIEGQEPLNLSYELPARNIAPKVSISPTDRRPGFVVSWFQDRFNDKQLCYYDSRTGESTLLKLENFITAYPVEMIFYKKKPFILIFKGNNSDNTDIFYYHLQSGNIKRITSSPYSNIDVRVTDEGNRVFIESNTYHYHYRFRLRKENLALKMTKKVEIKHKIPTPSVPKDELLTNVVVGLGDSITYGIIQYSETDTYHPEDAYLKQLERLMEEVSSPVITVNRGNSGYTTEQVEAELDDALNGVNAKHCLIMLGTNDVINKHYDPAESMESLERMVQKITVSYGMDVILSTIPPQKDERKYPIGVQQYIMKTLHLNARVIYLALQNDLPYIDPYKAFLKGEYDWEELLEPWKGGHPSVLGHEVIAKLFREKLYDFPPSAPRHVRTSGLGVPEGGIKWSDNGEGDIDYFNLEFGYTSIALNRTVTSTANTYQFTTFPPASPLDSKIYFRVQAVDKAGQKGPFTSIYSVNL